MVGGSTGMNEEGLAISSATAVAGSPATTSIWRTALVHRVLRQATDIDGALRLLREAADRTGWEFVLSHAPTRRICRVRFSEQGESLETDRTLVVARADICACTSDSARAASFAAESTSRMHEELSVLRDGFDPDAPASLARTDQIRAIARSRFGVVMSPRRGEIICRRGVEGQMWVDRYRFEPPPTARNDSPDHVAGDYGEPDGRGSPMRPEESSREFAVVPLRQYVAASQSIDGKPPFDRGGRVCSRFVSKMLETSLPPIEESLRKLGGPAMIVGSNPVGLALRKQVESLGQRAVVVPLSDDFDKTLAAVEKIWEAYRPLHLFLVTPFDDDATATLDPSDWQRRRHRGVMLPYAIAQKWFGFVSSAKLVEQASVVAATAMGGDYGLSGRIASLESGAVAGLVKGLSLEVGFTTDWAFRTKIIDAPKSEPPEQIAAAMLRELRAISFFVEIAYAGGRRYVTRAMHEPVAPAAQNGPTPGRPWLITGGARGITAAVARQLGARFGVKLHLVGTSPRVEMDPAWRDLTPEGRKQLRAELAKQAVAEKKVPADAWHRAAKAIEIDKNLRDLEQAGIATVYHVADVSDRAAMATLLDRIRNSDGSIEGIVHGAGVESSCRFTKKDLDMVSRTLAAKVDGAAVLMELTWDDQPRFFFGFGSIAGRWGSIGQTDYGLASDMLAKLVDWYRRQRPDCHAACFHWQPWAEIGMAARQETRSTNVLQLLQLLPPAEGVEHFLDELLAGAPEPEVLITDWDFYKRYCPDVSEQDIAEVYLSGQTVVPETAREPAPEPLSEPISPDDRVAMRHVMRMVEAPWEATPRKAYRFAGPALILGDNVEARALAERLAAAGVIVRPIPMHETADQTLSELQRMWGESPAPHLFLLTGRDGDAGRIADRQSWSARRRRGVELPFLVAQKWLSLVTDADLLDRSSLVAVTSLGGDFGFSRPVAAPEGGALSGLVKGLYMELCAAKSCAAKLRVIDAPPEEPPARLAEAILGELDVEGIDIEVAYDGGRRHVVR
ncbi:MAG TPA: hypothetical protein DD670_20575, partial [Planctomycetaceae bacterium]|nr:hypothetical protein [Planctomycetaceae bacterium]